MSEDEVVAWAEMFWRRAQSIEAFPRSLESTIAWILPLAVIKVPRLWLSELRTWLHERRIPFRPLGADRQLRACVIAHAGRGIVFLDGTDPEDERRVSLAHEVVHFLSDYLEPRERTIALLGDAAREVLDGIRLPSPSERLQAVFKGVELGTYARLLDRSEDGSIGRSDILAAEDRADRIALELLAPRRTVLARLAKLQPDWRDTSAVPLAQQVLVDDFGLPAKVAVRYAAMIVRRQRPHRGFRNWLGA